MTVVPRAEWQGTASTVSTWRKRRKVPAVCADRADRAGRMLTATSRIAGVCAVLASELPLYIPPSALGLFFKMAHNLDLRCILLPANWCWVLNTTRTQEKKNGKRLFTVYGVGHVCVWSNGLDW